jgi:hypothetical protein
MFGDLEQFGGAHEGSDGMSEAAMEAFREQMRVSGQQLKAQQKGEQKKKKKEEKLAKIISQFLQKKSKRTDLAFLAAEALALNIPPGFVLAALLLGDEDAQKTATEGLAEEKQSQITLSGNDLSYMMAEDEAQTARLHAQLIPWVDVMYIQAATDALRLIQQSHDEEGKLYPVMLNLPATVMKYFLQDNGLTIPKQNLETLARIILEKIFVSLQKNIDKLQEIREAEFGTPPGQEPPAT